MGIIALIAGVATAGAGLFLLAIWLIEYDRDYQTSASDPAAHPGDRLARAARADRAGVLGGLPVVQQHPDGLGRAGPAGVRRGAGADHGLALAGGIPLHERRGGRRGRAGRAQDRRLQYRQPAGRRTGPAADPARDLSWAS